MTVGNKFLVITSTVFSSVLISPNKETAATTLGFIKKVMNYDISWEYSRVAEHSTQLTCYLLGQLDIFLTFTLIINNLYHIVTNISTGTLSATIIYP